MGTSIGWGTGRGPSLPPPPTKRTAAQNVACPRPRPPSQHDFPASVSRGVPVKGGLGGAVEWGAARPSLCRGAPVEPTPRRISPAGRYRSGPAKLDTRGLQPALQRSYKEEEGVHSPGRPPPQEVCAGINLQSPVHSPPPVPKWPDSAVQAPCRRGMARVTPQPRLLQGARGQREKSLRS